MTSPFLPPLCPTFQSSQLWTPRHLHRVTIDQPHYHSYVTHSVHSHPPHLNALQHRVQRYGDHDFHLHKDIPVHQGYALTALRLSCVRPGDELVDRPLTKNRVIQKECCLPFPTEHPYTSHISQFAVFPDTHSQQQGHTHCECGTQTTHADLHPATPYYVTHKASEKGIRVEQHRMFTPSSHVTTSSDHVTTGGRGQLWDLPRSRRHQRSQSYPAPLLRIQYAASPQTPQTPLTISPHTQQALHTIHHLTAGTTSYRDHYREPPSPGGQIGDNSRRYSIGGDQILTASRPLYSAYSHSRPYTAESRAKYTGKNLRGADEEVWEREELEREGEVEIVMKDAATQTEQDDFLPQKLSQDDNEPRTSAQTITLPQLTTSGQTVTKPRPKSATVIPSLTKPPNTTTTGVGMGRDGTECGLESSRSDQRRKRSFSVDESAFIPRSTLSARRFSELYGFNRSDVLRRFHAQYPEQAPDLRQYGIQTGKRHIIHGYNSYHFH